MRDIPDGGLLLDLALEVLRERLLPLLPPERRYESLMVCRAIDIGARELAERTPAPAALGGRLEGMLGGASGELVPERRLAAAIRAGRLDGSSDLLDWLWRDVHERLRDGKDAASRKPWREAASRYPK